MTVRRLPAGAIPSIPWLAAMAATRVSWWLGADHARTAASVVVLTVAFVKVHVVGIWFMGLRDAPPALRLLFDGWVIAVGIAVNLLYLVR